MSCFLQRSLLHARTVDQTIFTFTETNTYAGTYMECFRYSEKKNFKYTADVVSIYYQVQTDTKMAHSALPATSVLIVLLTASFSMFDNIRKNRRDRMKLSRTMCGAVYTCCNSIIFHPPHSNFLLKRLSQCSA